MSKNSTDDFVKDRDDAMLSMDKNKIVAYLEKYDIGNPLDKSRLGFWAGIHKARTAIESLPMFERAASKRWLIQHGMDSLDDGEVLPPVKRSEQLKYYALCASFDESWSER